MVGSLLANNATEFERCLADVCDFHQDVDDIISGISRSKLVTRPPRFLPWLIEEYGLGELTPYVPNLYDLLDTGSQWQKIRGSLAAIDMGLAWLGLSADFRAAWVRRAWWNSFQLAFDRLPEPSQLEAIVEITNLSKSLRSDFRCATHGYSVGAVEGNMSRLDNALLDRESGVRMVASNTLFSFGQDVEINHTLRKEEGELIGNWIDDTGEELSWEELHYSWEGANFPWVSVNQHERSIFLAGWFQKRTLYLVLRDEDNALIGIRRCNIVQPVEQALEGVYSHSGKQLKPSRTGTRVLLAARTDFQDVDGRKAASVSVLVHATPAENIPLGKLWLQSEELIGGVKIIKTPVEIPLRADVRTQFKILLRF
ncbi:phage tail protein [Bartonella sp. cb54]|uniref:phage tail protein n=1 Tax=Bartonella sp. cb54 TaxID=3385560 RepID=UPI0039A5B433